VAAPPGRSRSYPTACCLYCKLLILVGALNEISKWLRLRNLWLSIFVQFLNFFSLIFFRTDFYATDACKDVRFKAGRRINAAAWHVTCLLVKCQVRSVGPVKHCERRPVLLAFIAMRRSNRRRICGSWISSACRRAAAAAPPSAVASALISSSHKFSIVQLPFSYCKMWIICTPGASCTCHGTIITRPSAIGVRPPPLLSVDLSIVTLGRESS